MFGGTLLTETVVDYNSFGLGGVLGAGGDIAYVLIFAFLAALSMLFLEPHGRPPV